MTPETIARIQELQLAQAAERKARRVESERRQAELLLILTHVAECMVATPEVAEVE